MEILLEDYKRRLETLNETIGDTVNTGSYNDAKKMERLRTKAGCYRTIISELEREISKPKQMKSGCVVSIASNINLTPIEIETPLVYESGAWDGKRSDLVLVKLRDNSYEIARLYSGFMDGSSFNDWYDANDYSLFEIVGWAELPK